MNKYDELFFSQYVSSGVEVLFVCHRHVVLIIDRILLTLFFFVFLPSFFTYYDSFSLASIPFWYFEAYLVFVYLTLLYAVLDWYNDVWIITDAGIIDVDWKFFSGNVTYIDYHAIHGIEVKRDGILDSLLWKGDIEIHLDNENEEFRLTEASNPDAIVDYIHAISSELREARERDGHGSDDGEPFQILMSTLTEMVREHLQTKGRGFSKEEDSAAKELEKKVRRRSGTIDLSSHGD